MQHTKVIKNYPIQHHGDRNSNDKEDAQNSVWCELGGKIAIITVQGSWNKTAKVGFFPTWGGGAPNPKFLRGWPVPSFQIGNKKNIRSIIEIIPTYGEGGQAGWDKIPMLTISSSWQIDRIRKMSRTLFGVTMWRDWCGEWAPTKAIHPMVDTKYFGPICYQIFWTIICVWLLRTKTTNLQKRYFQLPLFTFMLICNKNCNGSIHMFLGRIFDRTLRTLRW